MEYNFRKIEKDWQKKWKETNAYKVSNDSAKEKYYVLDMFPYPSGAGLHVGHPLGYIASDIYSRYKRLKGFNVLHPMGFDSFGLPAEQYAIETGQHPADTTEKNIATFKAQLDKIGFCYDWSREVRTSDPSYYKWTQWIFLQLFHSFFNRDSNKAEPISELQAAFEKEGNASHPMPNEKHVNTSFTSSDWKGFDEKTKQDILMEYRLAFSKYGEVNWCEALGTVLANDEVVNGVSERGGHPVEKRKMRQWYLRITEYADRLLQGLETVDFSDSMKEMQRNWIGRSEGAEMDFEIKSENSKVKKLRVYTTRPDTIFGVDFMVVAPELDMVQEITSGEQAAAVEDYLTYVKSRSDRERQAEVKQITGCFTGAYAINPFDGREIPIWISEYVLAGYGTGAIMAVPCGDQRDYAFAKHFNIPITNIIGSHYNGEEANPTKEAILENSGFLDGLLMKDAIGVALNKIEELGIGKRKINYRMRDAGFSRQRYWGEPFPIIWSDGIAIPLDADELPLELPYVEKYGPGPGGQGPLANIKEWTSSPSLLHGVEKGARENLTPNPSPKERGTEALEEYGYINSTEGEWLNTLPFAKKNRKEPTEAEKLMWINLRDRKIDGFKFRRQHPIAGYIPDFVCLEKKLIVEIDGGYHDDEEQKIFDAAREKWLQGIGFAMLRFTNENVTHNINKVLAKLSQRLSELTTADKKAETSPPLPWRGVGGEVKRETSTMPGYAGSSWYFLRYMDPHNKETFCSRSASDYWNQVDVYIGGTEHAVGHLLYSRLWTKVLFDLGYIGFDEPYKKLVNQGMITGKSFFFRLKHFKGDGALTIVNYDKKMVEVEAKTSDVLVTRYKYGHQFVDLSGRLSREKFELSNSGITNKINWEKDQNGEFLILKEESEKMSKSKFNVDNPDEVIDKYGADTFRMYEMFLGPIEASKPWDTKGIEGVHRFLRKLWRLFFDEVKGAIWTNGQATPAELKILHRTIKKIEEDTERFSFNTAVSTFMICVNELAEIKCNKKEILQPLLIMLTPYAPHIAEELWQQLGNEGSVLDAAFPAYDPAMLVESSKEYPLSINGKLRSTINLSLDLQQPEVEKLVLENETVQKWLEGKSPKKIIYVKNKMINVVV